MPIVPKLSVLRAFDPFLSFLISSKAKEFEYSKHRRQKIAKAAIIAILSVCYAIAMVADFWYCYRLEFNFHIIAFPFAILFNGTQLLLTYVSLWMNNERVEQSISTIDEMVNRREFDLGELYFWHRAEFTDWSNISAIGCSRSLRCHAKFDRLENRFTVATSIAMKTFHVNYGMLFGITAMIPIFYGIFHYPEPDNWATILQFK